MLERWKPVLGYEDLYQVSDRGRVRRIVGGQGAHAGHVLQPCNSKDGYLQVHLSRNNHGRTQKVHIIVAEAFLGPRLDGLDVNHKNGIKEDSRAVNLEYATRSENIRHNYDALGYRALRGEAHGQAKLTEVSVQEIRRLYAAGGVTQHALAERYDVTAATISGVLRRRTWTHVV